MFSIGGDIFADYSFFILSFFLSLSISIYFILRVNYFREYDDYEIGSEEWHYHYQTTNKYTQKAALLAISKIDSF